YHGGPRHASETERGRVTPPSACGVAFPSRSVINVTPGGPALGSCECRSCAVGTYTSTLTVVTDAERLGGLVNPRGSGSDRSRDDLWGEGGRRENKGRRLRSSTFVGEAGSAGHVLIASSARRCHSAFCASRLAPAAARCAFIR